MRGNTERHADPPREAKRLGGRQLSAYGAPEGPIFVVGHWRSGTTLLSVMLDRHSAIAVTPETHFAEQMVPRFLPSWPTPEERPDAGPGVFIERLLTRTRLADLQLEPASVVDRLGRRPLTPGNVFDSILRCYAASHGKPLVAEKTPGHLHHIPLLLEWFPDARFVWVVRDGRDAVLSLRRLPWVSLPLWDLCLRWRRNMNELRRFERLYPHRIHRVRYENLLEQPDSEIGRLCTFLDVPYEPLEPEPESNGQASRVVPSWEAGWKGRATAALDRSRIEAWRNEAEEREIRLMEYLMGNQLEALGYRLTTVGTRRAHTMHNLANAGLEVLLSRPIYPVVRGAYTLLVKDKKGRGA